MKRIDLNRCFKPPPRLRFERSFEMKKIAIDPLAKRLELNSFCIRNTSEENFCVLFNSLCEELGLWSLLRVPWVVGVYPVAGLPLYRDSNELHLRD
jgi:hypothetical protein